MEEYPELAWRGMDQGVKGQPKDEVAGASEATTKEEGATIRRNKAHGRLAQGSNRDFCFCCRQREQKPEMI